MDFPTLLEIDSPISAQCKQIPAERPTFRDILERVLVIDSSIIGERYWHEDTSIPREQRIQLQEDRIKEMTMRTKEWTIRGVGEKEGVPQTPVQRELRVRSMKELLWRAERLGYREWVNERGIAVVDTVQDLIQFITFKTRQHVLLTAGIAETEQDLQHQPSEAQSLDVVHNDVPTLLKGIATFTQLRQAPKNGTFVHCCFASMH